MLNIINNSKDILLEKKVQDAVIKINVYKIEDKIYIDIEDNGGGIKSDIDKIFEAYFTTKSSSEGTGLGLYMVKNIIEKNLNGKVTVKNGPNGAIFKIEIPNK
jgi:signal transduction histidine kinase